MDPMTMMTLGSLGMQAAPLFSGGGGGGGMMTVAPVSKQDKQLQKRLHTEAWKQVGDASQGSYDRNMVSAVIGKLRGVLGNQVKTLQDTAQSVGFSGDTIGSGSFLTHSLLSRAMNSMIPTTLTEKRSEANRSKYLEGMSHGDALGSMATSTAIASLRAQQQQSLMKAQQSSQQGKMLGNLAQTGGMMMFNNAVLGG